MAEALLAAAPTQTDGTTANTPAEAPASAPQTGEQKSDSGQPQPAAKPATEAPKAAEPVVYEFKAPEGISPEVMTAYTDIAKELKLPPADAQKVLDKVVPVMQARQVAQFDEAKTKWANETRADKEIGGDKLAANIALANKAIDKIGTPALRTLLEESGLGNHPEVIRFIARAGKAVSEDAYVAGARGPAQPEKTLGQLLYPNMK